MPLKVASSSQRHSEADLKDILKKLATPLSTARRQALLSKLCAGLHVWDASDWDPDWRAVSQHPSVVKACAEGASLAAPDFRAGVHVPREAGEQLSALEWPKRRSDFLAFAMPGFCHAAAAVTLALARAARPYEIWVVLISTLHAAVLSLSSATLVDFNAAAMAPVARIDALEYLQRLIMPSHEWAVYPTLEMYLDNLRPAVQTKRPMPDWAQPHGCDHARFERLRRDGRLDEAFRQGDAMLLQ